MKKNKTGVLTSRTSELVIEIMDYISKDEEHIFYDRSRSYIAHKILLDWAKKEKANL
jgi:hypothetical protein